MSTSPVPHTHAIVIAERVSSTLSVIGAGFVILTFTFDKRFRKPINRLVFYASFGNLLANVATLISRSGIELGVNSGLCQFQAFLIQWFMPADAIWTFAMALNCFLTFFHQYDGSLLRRLEWKYIVFCYGLPFIPALIYFFIETEKRGRVYGSAYLWCWVTSDWNVLRIVTFYGPVWLFIVTNVFIYVRVGFVVFKWRNQLISLDQQRMSSARRSMPPRDMQEHGPARTYEFQIHSQVPHDPVRSKHESYSKVDFANELASPRSPAPPRLSSTQARTSQAPSKTNTTILAPSRISANKATISYCFTALLFFIALLVTWVPSTINRLYTLVNDGRNSPFGLDFASALVLPLQGFWNCVIYIFTSKQACKAVMQDLRHAIAQKKSEPSSFTPSHFGRRKRGSQPLGSTDTRADIVISIDGKNRVVRHRSHESIVLSDIDSVPELTSPPPARMNHDSYERSSSASYGTTAVAHTLSPSSRIYASRAQRTSNRSSSHNSSMTDQIDVIKHERPDSSESDLGLPISRP